MSARPVPTRLEGSRIVEVHQVGKNRSLNPRPLLDFTGDSRPGGIQQIVVKPIG